MVPVKMVKIVNFILCVFYHHEKRVPKFFRKTTSKKGSYKKN